uniref:Minor capsid protein P8 central region domain-containing protein n=1 Tax=viral metagenome TaxID=1070528 RepID=A0A6C0CS22_9ZZZZ
MNAFADVQPMQPGQSINGRINILTDSSRILIPEVQRKEVNNKTFYAEALIGGFSPTPVSNLFFSTNNIDILQDGIRYSIYKRTNKQYVIGRQNDHDLKIVMRSIYLQYGRNLPTDIVGQVKELNSRVLEWTVNEVLSNLKQYQVYRKDASTLPMPMDYGSFVTQKGTKTLETKMFV